MMYIPPLAKLIQELSKLPGIGNKSAARLAFHILNSPKQQAQDLANAIVEAKDNIGLCSVCQNLAVTSPCPLCSDHRRDGSCICVVEGAKDVIVLEKTHEYNGLYHVLHGVISPMDNMGPEDLKIKELITRITDNVKEVIIATNPTIEGEATALYLAKLLKPLGILVTRIAYGIPVGGDLEYADEITITKALEGRREL